MSTRSIELLLEVMKRLRAPDGCSWDREQTFDSLVPHTLEEAYEVADAVQRGDREALREELGDLLFQTVFFARIGEEAGHFDFDAIAAGIVDKLIRRHPHVFGDAAAGSAEAQAAAWEAHKSEERRRRGGDAGALAGVASALPALVRAVKLQDRAARDGFDWPVIERVFDKLDEELAELHDELADRDPGRLEHELGDVLFVIANLARHLRIDPEAALRAANGRFERRYACMEAIAAERGGRFADLPLDEMEVLWQQAKRETDGA